MCYAFKNITIDHIHLNQIANRGPEKSLNAPFIDFAGPYETFLIEYSMMLEPRFQPKGIDSMNSVSDTAMQGTFQLHFNKKLKGFQGYFGVSD